MQRFALAKEIKSGVLDSAPRISRVKFVHEGA